MLASIPSEMLDEWMAYTKYESEEMDKAKRRAADSRKTEEEARKNALGR